MKDFFHIVQTESKIQTHQEFLQHLKDEGQKLKTIIREKSETIADEFIKVNLKAILSDTEDRVPADNLKTIIRSCNIALPNNLQKQELADHIALELKDPNKLHAFQTKVSNEIIQYIKLTDDNNHISGITKTDSHPSAIGGCNLIHCLGLIHHMVIKMSSTNPGELDAHLENITLRAFESTLNKSCASGFITRLAPTQFTSSMLTQDQREQLEQIKIDPTILIDNLTIKAKPEFDNKHKITNTKDIKTAVNAEMFQIFFTTKQINDSTWRQKVNFENDKNIDIKTEDSHAYYTLCENVSQLYIDELELTSKTNIMAHNPETQNQKKQTKISQEDIIKQKLKIDPKIEISKDILNIFTQHQGDLIDIVEYRKIPMDNTELDKLIDDISNAKLEIKEQFGIDLDNFTGDRGYALLYAQEIIKSSTKDSDLATAIKSHQENNLAYLNQMVQDKLRINPDNVSEKVLKVLIDNLDLLIPIVKYQKIPTDKGDLDHLLDKLENKQITHQNKHNDPSQVINQENGQFLDTDFQNIGENFEQNDDNQHPFQHKILY